jgi:hypothetical protein
MENSSLSKYTVSFGLSLAVTCILSALLVVLKELSDQTVLAWMKRVTMHHWVTHTVIDLILFVALGFLLAQLNGGSGVKISSKGFITAIVSSVAIGGLIIAGFYLIVG